MLGVHESVLSKEAAVGGNVLRFLNILAVKAKMLAYHTLSLNFLCKVTPHSIVLMSAACVGSGIQNLSILLPLPFQ